MEQEFIDTIAAIAEIHEEFQRKTFEEIVRLYLNMSNLFYISLGQE